MKWPWSRQTEYKPQVETAQTGAQPAILIASSNGNREVVEPFSSKRTIRDFIGVREDTLDLGKAVKHATKATGAVYPSDYDAYQDYLDCYRYVPWVARAIDIKTYYVWQTGYDLEGAKTPVTVAARKLERLEADTVFREGFLWALVFGNHYWLIEEKEPLKLKALGPWMGVTKNRDGEVQTYEYSYGDVKKTYRPDEILTLQILREPWSLFGFGIVRRCLTTVKALLYMKKYLPEIARQRADPWLLFTIQNPHTQKPYPKPEHDAVKKQLIERKPGENIMDDGSVKVQEIYQAAGVGGRQSLEGIMEEFKADLVGGLGVPEIYLGYGGTTLKGTAEHQEQAFESEVRSLQRELKRFHEHQLWPLLGIGPEVKVIWRPLKPEDLVELSKRLQGELEHSIVTREYAQQRLGYPGDMQGQYYINGQLFPAGKGGEKPVAEPVQT